MTIFMLKVLGSGIFWIVYFVVNFVVGGVTLKNVAPKIWRWIKTGDATCGDCEGDDVCFLGIMKMILIMLLIYLFWPIILFVILIGFIFSKILLPMFRKAVLYSGDIIPDIEIKTKTKED